MRIAIRTLRQALDVALIAVVVVILTTVLVANLAPALGHQIVVIRGGSMEPSVDLGSAVVLSRVKPAEIHPNDVVTVKAPNGVLVTHRVVEVVTVTDGTYVRLKGDANKSADATLVPVSAVQGRAAFVIPVLGYLMYMLSVPTGILAVFLLAATLLLSVGLLEELEEDEDEAEDESAVEPALDRQNVPATARRRRRLIAPILRLARPRRSRLEITE